MRYQEIFGRSIFETRSHSFEFFQGNIFQRISVQFCRLIMGMRIWTLLVVLIFLFVGPRSTKAEEKGNMDQLSLPAEAGDWKWDKKKMNYNSRTIFNYINGAAELYLAYGFQSLAVRRFEKPGQPPIIAEVYEMRSSEEAYGIFSYEHQDEEAGVGQGSEFGGGLLRFWKGKYFVSVYAEGESPEVEPAILTLGRAVADSLKVTGPAPKLIGALPDGKAGLMERSIRYLHSHVLLNQRFFVATQNILNLNQQTEAILAQYLRDGRRIHLLLIRYPTEKEAEAALQNFKKTYMPETLDKAFLRTEDKKWTGAKRQREFVLIVFGGGSAKEAEELIQATEEKVGAM